jgi:hypothetical protein
VISKPCKNHGCLVPEKWWFNQHTWGCKTSRNGDLTGEKIDSLTTCFFTSKKQCMGIRPTNLWRYNTEKT